MARITGPMTRCENCQHEFHNVMLRLDCPKCGKPLTRLVGGGRVEDPDPMEGFALGVATGAAFGSPGALLGSTLHTAMEQAQQPTHERQADPAPAPAQPDPAPTAQPDPAPSGSAPDFGGGSFGGGTDPTGGG